MSSTVREGFGFYIGYHANDPAIVMAIPIPLHGFKSHTSLGKMMFSFVRLDQLDQRLLNGPYKNIPLVPELALAAHPRIETYLDLMADNQCFVFERGCLEKQEVLISLGEAGSSLEQVKAGTRAAFKQQMRVIDINFLDKGLIKSDEGFTLFIGNLVKNRVLLDLGKLGHATPASKAYLQAEVFEMGQDVSTAIQFIDALKKNLPKNSLALPRMEHLKTEIALTTQTEISRLGCQSSLDFSLSDSAVSAIIKPAGWSDWSLESLDDMMNAGTMVDGRNLHANLNLRYNRNQTLGRPTNVGPLNLEPVGRGAAVIRQDPQDIYL